MAHDHAGGQVLLAENRSASEILHALLADAIAAFPDTFTSVAFPADAVKFRKAYPDVLPHFEAARRASTDRHAISRHITTAMQQNIEWRDDSGPRPLHEALNESAEPLLLKTHAFTGKPGWQPSLVYRGERWEAAQLAELGALLVERGVMSADAGDAVTWVSREALDAGTLHLAGRKIAVLGGGAEMAPTRLWLASGADVLWLDTTPPPGDWFESPDLSGRLYWPEQNADLLAKPQEVLATLIAFADGAPLDLGLYAYAPGRARELRLTASMNAIVNALPQALISSVTMLVSPTTPAALSSEDLAEVRRRIETRPLWESACARIGLLGRGGGSVSIDGATTTRTVVAIQGASYQAAQYLGKVLMAECWAEHGQVSQEGSQPLRISANTAAITRTRSLDHPVFAAAFGGAAAFGVETLVPRQSRRLNGLLAVRDWLQPALPVPGAVRVHGGIHTLPYPLGSALRIAAVIGFARSPRLLRGLISR
jgi:hypothetical protein